MQILFNRHFEACLSDTIINELFDISKRKNENRLFLTRYFLDKFPYTLVNTPETFDNMPKMRDIKDMPILAAAIESDADYLVTGDKDFFAIDIEKPVVLP